MPQQVEGVELATAIAELRRQLEKSVAEAAIADVQFPVQEVVVELSMVATSSKEGSLHASPLLPPLASVPPYRNAEVTTP